jgi:hypothetical protein
VSDARLRSFAVSLPSTTVLGLQDHTIASSMQPPSLPLGLPGSIEPGDTTVGGSPYCNRSVEPSGTCGRTGSAAAPSQAVFRRINVYFVDDLECAL